MTYVAPLRAYDYELSGGPADGHVEWFEEMVQEGHRLHVPYLTPDGAISYHVYVARREGTWLRFRPAEVWE